MTANLGRVALGVVLALALVGASGCGSGREEATRVYFVDGYRSDLGMRGRLVARERSMSYEGLGRVVAEVLRGPTPSEAAEQGLISGFPAGVRVSTVALSSGTARIRLASATPPRRWPGEYYATAQLVYTLTELPNVERVVLTVDGKRCCVYDMQQRPWTKPLTRRLFANWQGAPAAVLAS